MALNKNHQHKIDMMNAFDSADRNTPRDGIGRASYGMGAGGMPRTPAQMASVKKAAKASATARGERAMTRSPKAPTQAAPGVATGSTSLVKKPKTGLLGL
jgi:hypothetical protein